MRLTSAVGRGLPLMLLGAALACSACSDNGSNPPGPSGSSEKNVVKGKATDTAGRPLAGVEVVADNQVLYNSDVVGVTGADGTYRLELGQAAATWNTSARLKRDFNGRSYTFELHPSNASPFAGNEGAVRDFDWRLTGARPGGGFYGSGVFFRLADYVDPADPDQALQDEHMELTLTPVGPLVDGSTGSPVTGRGTSTGDGFGMPDVAIARYTVTGRYAPPGQAVRPLLVRVQGEDTYADSVTADFKPLIEGGDGPYRIGLELKFP
ncbi:carboxypeptidase-like regulatory domain-containing protein [Comamonas sp. JC664]|uniref:carboxypeptidase-like regulatory domain-containing protein n=1 Tax=Comamonas sp. JC664 TaxID=2801917 RepID=UPI00174E4C4E|nr:carboxypeptidase-like regulatory domain-containing protein [Comamonas sp. JC664]MBL0693891.1 carboxypeptidase regulatory-like domain-containing protein [Comamonas sp. JC664]